MSKEKNKPKIINAWSSTGHGKTSPGEIVVISNADGKRKIEIVQDYPWYFYIERSKDALKELDDLKDKGFLKEFREGKKYIKVWMDKKFYKDKGVNEIIKILHAKNIQTLEADVGPAKRYLLDLDFEIEDFDNINLYYFDIETDDSTGKLEYETKGDFTSINAKDRILSVAFVGRDGKPHFLYNEDEKTLLITVNQFLKNFNVDMLVGWNSKDFDIPYLWKRMEVHGINSSYLRNILHEDMMKRVQYFYSKDPEARQNITSYSLNTIAKYFLNDSKVEREGKVIDLMKTDFKKFKEYNIKDAELLCKLEEKLGLIRLTYQMFQMCHCTAQNWSMIKAIDNFILYEANRNQIHYPTNKAYFEEDKEEISQYLGALVLDPTPGYYTEIYDLDFKSLYPNIIRTFNISPETLSPKISGVDLIETPGMEIDGVVKGKVYFEREEGVIPRKIKLLLEEREKIRTQQKKLSKSSREYKDLNVKQLVVKELANSIYGVIGNPYFRGFNIDMAEAITATGQHLITYLKRTYEEKGRQVIYGDTDSVFVKLKEGEDVKVVLEETNKELSLYLKENFNIKNSTIELAFDKKFDKFLIESKKKYVGETEGNLKFVGMEAIKRDTIPIASKLQKELITKIFRQEKDIEWWILDKKQEFQMGMHATEDILIHKKMAKNASSYKAKGDKKYTPPLHVRIAKELKISGDKTDLSKGGSIISYVVTKGSPMEGVHISEYKGEYDREYYWNSLIYPMLERVLKVAIPEVEWDVYYIIKEKIKKDARNKPRQSVKKIEENKKRRSYKKNSKDKTI